MKQSYKKGGLVRNKVTSINTTNEIIVKLNLLKENLGISRNEIINDFCENALVYNFDNLTEGQRPYPKDRVTKVLPIRMSDQLLISLSELAKIKNKTRDYLINEILENI